MAKQVKKEMKAKLGQVITCECCGKEIVKEHSYQIYCSECSYKVKRQKNNIALKKFRDKKKKEIEQMKQRLAELEQLAQQQVNGTADTADTTEMTDTTDTDNANDRSDS